MSQEEDIKKIMRLLDKGESYKKPAKDIQTSILQKIASEPGNDIKTEYFKLIKECRLMKTALIQCLNNTSINNGLNEKGQEILDKLTEELTGGIEALKPTIMSDGTNQKFRFKDGSESTFENYNQVKDTVLENILLNKINKLENICSNALGFIATVEKQMWHRDDGIEEIDITKGSEEKKSDEDEMEEVITNGRTREGPSTD